MSAYVVSRLTIHDRAAFGSYLAETPRTVPRFGGKYLFRGGEVTALEGNWDDERLVILEFETAEAARAWYRSAEYRRLRELRQRAADAVILLAGTHEAGEGAVAAIDLRDNQRVTVGIGPAAHRCCRGKHS
jgi:uncharacterized protein (DUF1330 family)